MPTKEIVTLTGNTLKIDELLKVARGNANVKIADDAYQAMKTSRDLKIRLIELKKPIYGVTTGFGDSADRQISPDKTRRLQHNLIQYHINGTGPDAPIDVVTAAMVIRANCLARGASAVNPVIVNRLVEMINERIIPIIPVRGSVGASGDLVPLCYLANTITGHGSVYWRNEVTNMESIMTKLKWKGIELEAKDGLGLINGTSFSSAFAALALEDARRIAKFAEVSTAMASEALLGNRGHFAPFLFQAKPHPGQSEAASNIYSILADSKLAMDHSQVLDVNENLENRKFLKLARSVQDRYSIRCAPHVIGVLKDTLEWAQNWITTEINSSNDNPLFSVDDSEVYSGGNFYGGHVTQAMDSVKAAVANIADLMDRQLALLVDARFSNGLASNLAPLTEGTNESETGLHHGFKGMQLAASAVTAEVLKGTMPASVFSRSTESHNQDKVSMSAIAARDASTVLRLTEEVTAIHILACAQAIELRGSDQAANYTRSIVQRIRKVSAFVEIDRSLHEDITQVLTLLRQNKLLHQKEEEMA